MKKIIVFLSILSGLVAYGQPKHSPANYVVINAADNGEPYSAEELKRLFLQDYQLGYDYLKRFGIEEIS